MCVIRSGFSAFLLTALVFQAGCGDSKLDQQIQQTQSQVQRLATQLDRRTTEAGVYVRVKEGEIHQLDSWGTPLEISYSQGGFAEILVVRSAGPDQKFDTADDLQASAMSANLKGIGSGIKQNAEETASNTAKGLVKGTIAGVKESFSKK